MTPMPIHAPDGAKTNDETGSECRQSRCVFHLKLLRIKVNG